MEATTSAYHCITDVDGLILKKLDIDVDLNIENFDSLVDIDDVADFDHVFTADIDINLENVDVEDAEINIVLQQHYTMPPSPPLSSASSFASSGPFSVDLSSSRILHRRRIHGAPASASATTAARTLAFLAAILSSLCAGSVTVFSLYGHIFQERLRYSQFQVNGIAIASSISCYLPVSLVGYVCDRVGPAPLSLLSSVLFAVGYGTAALLYKKAASEAAAGTGGGGGGHPAGPTTQAYAFMVTAFVFIGTATCAMYLSAVTTCAKNFGRGRHRGLALAAPIAAFGLSGMWLSQLGSRVLYERLPPLPEDGPGAPPRKGDVDVFAFFIFLAVLLAVVGLLGAFTLRVVDEEQLVDDAVDHLERSGLLDGSALFSPSTPAHGGLAASADSASRSTRFGPGVSGGSNNINTGNGNSSGTSRNATYGTMGRANPFYDGARSDDDEDDDDGTAANETTRILGHARSPRRNSRESENDALAARLLDPSKDDDDDDGGGVEAGTAQEQARFKKTWVLNAETHRFLTDHTMWLFALGFFFMIGPGEAFINNLGTVIQTLYPPTTVFVGGGGPTTAATHVSIVGMTSTIARLLTGSLTDLLAPRPQTQHLQVANDVGARGDYGDSDDDEYADTDEDGTGHVVVDIDDGSVLRRVMARLAQLSISRVAFLLAFALLLSGGLVVLASGVVQNHGDRFWIVSGLVGAGYGAVFSLTPIIITVIWGVENFGTNWGIVAMFPALGATLWGLVYSAVYQAGVAASPRPPASSSSADGDVPPIDDGNHCYGTQCYAPTFWAMAGSVWLACVLVLLAWKGRNGWSQRGIVI